MIFRLQFQQAVVNFTASKLRSLLAILGILVGTAAVVALLSSGRLATDKALMAFKTLGTDLLAITVYHTDHQNDHSQNNNAPSPQQDNMTLANWRELAQRVPGVKKIAPYVSAYQTTSYQGQPLRAAIIGADESLADIIHIQLAKGYFVSFLQSFEHYCVIGDDLAQQLRNKTLDDPLGKQLQIGKNLYTIIGIARHWQENPFFNEDINRAIITPIAGIRLITQDEHHSSINNAIVLLQHDAPIDNTIKAITDAIKTITPSQMIYIRSAKQTIASMESQGRIFTLLLTVIGGVSLLVGGIGVMNVMLVSVSERKKEIGIRRAVGATTLEIQHLFLIESILLSMAGGGLGILLGELLTWLIAYFSNWPFTLYALPPLAGFFVSAAAGIFFGYYPARRAAKLDPIVSLRSD